MDASALQRGMLLMTTFSHPSAVVMICINTGENFELVKVGGQSSELQIALSHICDERAREAERERGGGQEHACSYST